MQEISYKIKLTNCMLKSGMQEEAEEDSYFFEFDLSSLVYLSQHES